MNNCVLCNLINPNWQSDMRGGGASRYRQFRRPRPCQFEGFRVDEKRIESSNRMTIVILIWIDPWQDFFGSRWFLAAHWRCLSSPLTLPTVKLSPSSWFSSGLFSSSNTVHSWCSPSVSTDSSSSTTNVEPKRVGTRGYQLIDWLIDWPEKNNLLWVCDYFVPTRVKT